MDNKEKMQKSSEFDSMMKEYTKTANELLDKYGPEGAYEICKILDKLIDDDISPYVVCPGCYGKGYEDGGGDYADEICIVCEGTGHTLK